MWMTGYRYSWRKMEAAAQDRAGWSRVVCGHASLGVTRHKRSEVNNNNNNNNNNYYY